MKRKEVTKEEAIRSINVIEGKKVMLISINERDRAYYAEGIRSRKLNVKRYEMD